MYGSCLCFRYALASQHVFALCIVGQNLMLGHCSISEKSGAVQALMFVRDLDTSLLGQNANGLEQFECLRQCTDELVNAILHVRQLLKRRRFDEGEVFIHTCVFVQPAAF